MTTKTTEETESVLPTIEKDVADLFFDSFGVSADMIAETVTKIVKSKDYKTAAFCVGCSVQVRDSVVRRAPKSIEEYPIFKISGDRSKTTAMIRDNINLKALRLCGQVFLNGVKDTNMYAQKALERGNYFTGTASDPTSEAGRIILEVSKSFTEAEKTKLSKLATSDPTKAFSSGLMASMMRASGKS